MAVQWTEEQQKVIDLRERNILVNAAAGSGKTAVLVERILQLISEGDHPLDVDQLLVVTFTRAAAAQMKERLTRALLEKLETDPDNEHLQRQTTLIHHAQITTIDGFCSYVIRNYFQQIDLDPGFRITDEGEQKLLMKDVLAQVLEESYEKKTPEFMQLAESLDSGRSDERLEDTVLKLYALSQSHPWPQVWLKECLKPYEAETVEELLASDWLVQVEIRTKELLQEALLLNEKAREISVAEGGPSQYLEALEADRDFLEEAMTLEGYDHLQPFLKRWKPKALSRKTVPGMVEERKLRVQELRSREKEMVQEKIVAAFFQDTPEEILAKLKIAKPAVQGLVTLTERFTESFYVAKQEKNLLDFSDVEHLALQALIHRTEDGGEERTEAARELSCQYGQIMIDEYQDSNLVQEKILTAVSRESQGIHNLFMVGDVKQSIYKFRLARPELFMEKYDTYTLEENDCQRVDLHRNFRSRTQVIDSVNRIFARIMTKSLGGISYDPSVYLYPGTKWKDASEEGYGTEILLIGKDTPEAKETASSRELEAVLVADRIRKMVGKETILDRKTGEKRKVRYGDIVILLRSLKGWSDVFAQILKSRGISSCSVSRVGYFSAPEVMVVLSFLRILDNPRQEIPLASVLTSPIVGLDADGLARIKNCAPKEPLYVCARKYPDSPDGEPELAAKLTEFWSTYEKLREKTSYVTVRELLTCLYEETGYLDEVTAMPAGEQRRANLLMLIEKAAEYEKTSYSGLFHFVRYIDSLKKYEVDFGEAQTGGEDADMVRIMSIHNSKGLEFPVVIVAGMGKNFNLTDTREMVTLHPDLGIGIPCIDTRLRTREETLYHRVIQNILREETLGEELRILYVAMTRAEQKLILTGTLSQAEKKITAAMEAAGEKTLGYGKLLFASSCLDWILPALGGSHAMEKLAVQMELPSRTVEAESALPEGDLTLRLLSVEELVEEELTQQMSTLAASDMIEAVDADKVYDKKTRENISGKLNYVYPHQKLQDMPAKLSVSELKFKAYEEEQGHSLFEEPEVIPYIPAFMQGSKQTASSGALRGTAYHRMMECLDYQACAEGVSLPEQISRLTERGMLSKEDADMLKPEDFERFLQSPLGKRMQNAQLDGRLFRERQFFLTVDAGEADPQWKDSGETILVQGIIDAYFETDEGLILVDYKTDKVERPDGSDLIEKYRVQLDYYAEALTRLTGQPVVEKLIYSFALHTELKL